MNRYNIWNVTAGHWAVKHDFTNKVEAQHHLHEIECEGMMPLERRDKYEVRRVPPEQWLKPGEER